MMELILSLLSGPNALLSGLAALLATIIGVYFKGRNDKSRADVKARLDARIEADKIEDAVAGLSDKEVREKLRRYESRP
jgi:hypothetical protein